MSVPMHNRSWTAALVAAVLALGVALGGCAPEIEERTSATVRVRPQVVVDGLVELTARTDGAILLDEVLLHAPAVHALDGEDRDDLLRTDPINPGALFFRYDLDDPEGSAVASERRWALRECTDEAEVVFGFSPLLADGDELRRLEARAQTGLAAMNGYTALIHGFVAVELDADDADARTLFAANSPGEVSAGDGDGLPADHREDHQASAGDGDGLPADDGLDDGLDEGLDEGIAAGDGDGLPAEGGLDEGIAAGDGDGLPAEGPDELAAGDGDGLPAEGGIDVSKALGDRGPRVLARREVLKPFTIVIPSAMELSLPIDELRIDEADEDSYLPLDLHIDIGTLLSQPMIDQLRQVRADDEEEKSLVVRDIRGAFELETRRTRDRDADTSRLRNITDARK